MLDPESLPGHLDRLYRAALALCGSAHDADDLVQETLVRVLGRRRRLRGSAELPYLLRALRNTHLNGLRSHRRRPQTVELSAAEYQAKSRAVAGPQTAVERRAVLAGIAALPQPFRDALVAVDITGLSYREAAGALGIREATVTSRLFRARARIAKALEPSPAPRPVCIASREGPHRGAV